MRHTQPFSSVSLSWFTAAALAGWAGCGFSSGSSGNNGKMDASVGQDADAMGGPPSDAFDGTCYGPAGWQACFPSTSPPSGSFMLPGTISTDGGAPCLNAQPIGWTAPQPAACFIVADTITVPSGGTIVNGAKPLVLVAKSLITVAGLLDVASHQGDPPGTKPGECQAFSQTPNLPGTGVGGGGGAGGSFRTRAGNGGNGDGGSQNGQSAPADAMAAPDHLRGGCPGQAGGALTVGDAGKVGFGGGSIYLVAGGEIALQNSINASGAGGGGGNKGSGGNAAAGGGGGGSGGMIVLYAATLTVPAAPVLMANGGGGGGGGIDTSPAGRGGPGSDPIVASALLAASGGGPNGGKGDPVIPSNDINGTSGNNGGGGGGGGGAVGYIRSNKPLTGAIVSPLVDIVP